MSEATNYRIAIDFRTDRPLTVEELVDLGGQAWTQVNEPSEEQPNEDDPYTTIDAELRLWIGENEVAGLNAKPVYHAHVAWYHFFEEGNPGRTARDADDTDWHCFADEKEAEQMAQGWLADDAWERGCRAHVGVRMIVVPEWVFLYLNSSETSDEDDLVWADWSSDEVWNEERRVGERMRVWLAS